MSLSAGQEDADEAQGLEDADRMPIVSVQRAGIVGQITESSSNTAPAGFFVRWVVEDTGLPGGEGDGFRRLATTSIPIVGCPTANEFLLEHGYINIHNAQP